MLRIAGKFTELDFEQLMGVYVEGNQENAEYFGMTIREAECSFGEYLRESFFPQSGAVYCIWEADGCYQAALRLEPYGDGLLLEALETKPESRRRGYARSLILAVQAWLRERENPKVYSHVSKRNQASLGVHRACGFQKLLDCAEYVDGTVSTNAVTLCWQE